MDDSIQNQPHVSRKQHDQQERLKELSCLNRATSILREGKPADETLQQLALLLPAAWQYPEYTVVRITYGDKSYESPGFMVTPWSQVYDFETISEERGSVEVYYTREFLEENEGPFLKEEHDLLRSITGMITGYFNSMTAGERYILPQAETVSQDDENDASIRKLLQKFLDRHNAERDVFHDLMPFMVKEILLVASLYDAYSIEGEGRFSDHMLGEYHQLSLTSIPRVTGVSSEQEAFTRLKARHYDMIIIMIGVDKETPMLLCSKIKERYPYIPIFILINNPEDIQYMHEQKSLGVPFDNYFVWTGESKVFFAMVKLLEDRVNVENDTRRGLTRVILLIEDSADYYSKYVPMLYNLVLDQTKNLIEDVSTDELYKVLKIRARPKILLASTYEEALLIYSRYKEWLLGVISDMRFPKDGKLHDTAGFDLIKQIKEELPNLPTVLQSSDPGNVKYADLLKADFINKNSESLLQDLRSFITYYLGFGHFVYRDTRGRKIAVARSMKEFEGYLKTIPEDSLAYHAMKNHFSLWLMARGEVKIAQLINPLKISDFDSLTELREFLVDVIRRRRKEMNKGKVVTFDESLVIDETNVVSMAGGSLGGKGRGLAFINTLIYSFELGRLLSDINIKTPVTVIIGTDEFDDFMESNRLWDVVKNEPDFEALQKAFLNGHLSFPLEKKMRILAKYFNKPLAVRSSSLFEDSMSQPFSGVFGTYLLPNNNPDPEARLKQLTDAVKLVFASIYSDNARTYFEAIGHKVELEKMAVVIQSVVGTRHGNVFYPHISGSAQSFNFYPVSRMTPQDGFAAVALGLGQYVLEGENTFRFSPAYPDVDVVSFEDLAKNSQRHFYAIDLGKQDPDLLQGENAGLITLDISKAEEDGTLRHCASVLSIDNQTLNPGLDGPGPRIVNFANILKYDYVPLASTLRVVLNVVKEALGAPVEIEFAVDLTKDEDGRATFYLLQIKPLVGSGAGYNIDPDTVYTDDTILVSNKSMGNGVVTDITDIIYLEPDKFNNLHTTEMVNEIDAFNKRMIRENRKYVLIGPGRWGTRDRFLGIPVVWPQISFARVIVEMGMTNFHTEASLGSHFFHNVTSMNIGYFSVNQNTTDGLIDWRKLHDQKLIHRGKFFRQVRFDTPLLIRMDGKKGIAVISLGNNS